MYDNLPFNFLGLPPEFSSYDLSSVVVLPAGYDSTTSYVSGTREAPLAIIKASRFMEFFDPELKQDFTRMGIATLPPFVADMDGPQKTVLKLERAIDDLLKDRKFVVMLGGEHTLTVGAVNAFLKHFPGMGILQIDAHLDLRENYDGTRFNHACAMRRVVDDCPVTQVGIRSVSQEEFDFVEKKGLKPHYAWEMKKNPHWKEEVERELPKDVYVTIDLDGLDPSIMPSVGTPEPGGLLWDDLMDLLTRVSLSHRIVGFDVVELCPIPNFISPDYLASKLVYRLIGLAHRDSAHSLRI